MKCCIDGCVNNNEWSCMYRYDCDDCTRGCKNYYQCDSCDYYMHENIENDVLEHEENMINISYEDIIKHIVVTRLNDIDGNMTHEQHLRLHDECIGVIRLASVIYDVPFIQVYDDVFDAVCERE